MSSTPETYYFKPTVHVPNSKLPVLIYRTVLEPKNVAASRFQEKLENNHWVQGGVFRTFTAHHFHSVTHECYAVFSGSTRLLLGRGPLDEPDGGIEINLRVGDAIVLPAGVAHCSLNSEGDYKYLGLYPEGSPKWDNNFCKAGLLETQEKGERAAAVAIPDFDPIFGKGGPLVSIWSRAVRDKERD